MCRLNKSLYGLKQSPRNWNQVLDTWFMENGFVVSEADPCLYMKFKAGPGEEQDPDRAGICG